MGVDGGNLQVLDMERYILTSTGSNYGVEIE